MDERRSIFVFGSNLAGRHGAGAALAARKKWGAQYGVGKGPTGSAYAIPTKGKHLEILDIKEIEGYVKEFIEYANANPDMEFFVTRVGCGLAGYKDHEIAPLFRRAPHNCSIPHEWRYYLED